MNNQLEKSKTEFVRLPHAFWDQVNFVRKVASILLLRQIDYFLIC